ncbi:cyclic nucleotide-binding domain-containing protein [Solitalea sp. MAHUQ-68]|uniref:Cyclic nucleotide-binding domain-containing protein n=1 Tax=Solitalea agri TaxID=2953739 RepID=A0A9X2F167_9SPHI|nr:cyclic nucleotide-binding domain-containing protein [Solitalea agri]MCO4292175.1 cyclic nucleotide-binding domain-containing protein [Solitalea agri]
MLIIEKVLLLKNSEIFKNSRETDLVEIASICEECSFDKDVLIFSKGDKGNCMYFIYSGKVLIHDEGHEIVTLGENEIFGELSLLDTESRSASVTTLADCVLLKIEQEAFYDVIATNTDILKGIMRTLCKRLREQDRVTIEMKKVMS